MTEETFYVSKYALTAGIQEVTGRVTTTCTDLIAFRGAGDRYDGYAFGEGRQWHRTREEAVKRAEVMQARKLASIDKQRARVAALTF